MIIIYFFDFNVLHMYKIWIYLIRKDFMRLYEVATVERCQVESKITRINNIFFNKPK